MMSEYGPFALLEKADTTFNAIGYQILDQNDTSSENPNGTVVVGADFYPREEDNYYVVTWRGGKGLDSLTSDVESLLQRVERMGAAPRPDFSEYRFMILSVEGHDIFIPTSRPLTLALMPEEQLELARTFFKIDTPYGSFCHDDTDFNHKTARIDHWQLAALPETGFITHVESNLGFYNFIESDYPAPSDLIFELVSRLQQRMDGTTPTTEVPHVDPEPVIKSN
jgi:hypothetical protein